MTNKEGYYYIIYNNIFQHYDNNVYIINTTNNIYNDINIYKKAYISPCDIKYISDKCINIQLAKKIIDNKLLLFKYKNSSFFYKNELNNLITIIQDTIDNINNNNLNINYLIDNNILDIK